MSLPNGARFGHGERERIEKAVAELEKDAHAPKEITVNVVLHVHRDYPKHVIVGKDEDGNPITKIANNADEEKALTPKKE